MFNTVRVSNKVSDTSNITTLAYGNKFTIWHYRADNENLETLKQAGYFDNASNLFRVGDLVIINSRDMNTCMWVVQNNKDGVQLA